MKKIAFVTPWYGEELKGGAEQQVWQVANRLAERGHKVEVLTTCCASFLQDWATNHLPAGTEQAGEVIVRRFKVDKRDGALFNRANTQGLSVPQAYLKPGVNPFALGNDNAFVTENINSAALEDYLQQHAADYHCFIFIPYLYGIIINGLPLVAAKSWLQPCLHHEAYAFLPSVEILFRSCKGILLNSDGEKELARRFFGPGIMSKSHVVGEGVEVSGTERPNESSLKIQNHDLGASPFVLCLGRRDSTKNTEMLVAAYRRYRKGRPAAPIQLVLAGPGDTSYGKGIEGLHDLGLVTSEEKEQLLSHCLFLFQPSKNESYSRVIMEAWLYGKPVAVHCDCLATSMAVAMANGGILAGDEEQWTALFHTIATMSNQEKEGMGKNGRAYAQKYAQWETVLDCYEEVLGLTEPASPRPLSTASLPGNGTIHQLLPGFAYGDAISNQAMAIRDILRQKGFRSEIFTEHRDPLMEHEALIFQAQEHPENEDGIIYHHSIGAGLTQFVVDHQGPKSLIYHNITPPDLVRAYDPDLADVLAQGLKDLKVLAPQFPISCGDSQFNCDDLQQCGFSHPAVLPICISPDIWNVPTDPNWMQILQDGKTNILFVGRVIANKCQHDLIDAFAEYFKMYRNCRLILVGGYRQEENYYQYLKEKCRALHLEWDILFLGKVPESVLHSCYRCADLFWSMSEHEGFGVPLIEAMWFGIPVFAFSSSAVPETLGNSGLLFTQKDDLKQLAVTAHLLITNTEIRQTIIEAQYQQAKIFLPDPFTQKVEMLLQRMYANTLV